MCTNGKIDGRHGLATGAEGESMPHGVGVQIAATEIPRTLAKWRHQSTAVVTQSSLQAQWKIRGDGETEGSFPNGVLPVYARFRLHQSVSQGQFNERVVEVRVREWNVAFLHCDSDGQQPLTGEWKKEWAKATHQCRAPAARELELDGDPVQQQTSPPDVEGCDTNWMDSRGGEECELKRLRTVRRARDFELTAPEIQTVQEERHFAVSFGHGV